MYISRNFYKAVAKTAHVQQKGYYAKGLKYQNLYLLVFHSSVSHLFPFRTEK